MGKALRAATLVEVMIAMAVLAIALILAALALTALAWPWRRPLLASSALAWASLNFPVLGASLRWEQQSLAALALLAGARRHRSVNELLGLAATAVDHPTYRAALHGDQALSGSSLHECLKAHSDLFSPELIWLVHQGESSGHLGAALELAISYLRERRQQAEARAQLALSLGLQVTSAVLVLFYLVGFWLPFSAVYGQLIEGSAL